MSVRKMLAEYLHSQAKWREMKADEHPDDDRNMRASNALSAAAEVVAGLAEDEPRLRKMADAGWFQDGLCAPGEYGRDVVRRYGFHRADQDHLLDDLAAAAVREDEERLGAEVDDILPDDTLDD